MKLSLNQYFRNIIKNYYLKNSRNFFWRTRELTPFQFLIIEVLLKKTQAEPAEKIIKNFIKEYPSNEKLLNASTKSIYRRISHLGLGKQRSKSMKRIASFIKKEFNNRLPCSKEELLKIPYVGLYTCHAVLCFAFNERFDILDVNSSRIISRFFDIKNDKDLRDNSPLRLKSFNVLPRKKIKEYNWGLLDFGAKICKTKPMCSICPLRKRCNFIN